jgi:redox-sensitive bicupin YhaK (pirin superfamily)
VGSGEVELGPEGAATPVREGTLAVLGEGRTLRMRAKERGELLIAAARPLGEPIVQRGPFVMTTEKDVRRAFADYQAGVLDR